MPLHPFPTANLVSLTHPEQVAKHLDEHDASLVTSRLQVIGEVCEPNFVLRVGECHLPAGTVMPEGRTTQEGTRV